MQDSLGLASLKDGMSIRTAQSRMLSIVRPYVLQVAENEGKSSVGAAVVAALNSVYKTCNNDAARKIRAHLHALFLKWVKSLDDEGKLEPMLTDGPWYMPASEVSGVAVDIRDGIKVLSNITRFKRSQAWRNAMRRLLDELASRKPGSQVRLYAFRTVMKRAGHYR